MKLAGLFPGQGSQIVGMGASFAEEEELARDLFNQADTLLGYSLSKLCLEGPIDELSLTQNGQPAILLVSTICHRLSNLRLDAAAGHSLGEYSALVAAGAISFEDAIQLVHKRGRYMQEAVPAGEGKMLAVMGLEEDAIEDLIRKVSSGIVEIANLNCPGQTVIAGDNEGVDSFAALASSAKLIPLNVSAPFHCSLMHPAAEALNKDLDAITFSDLAFPVYVNVSAEGVTNGTDAREFLRQQVCGSVRWADCVKAVISERQPDVTVEFGPGGVLSKLMKRIDRSVKAQQVFDPASLQKLRDTLN